MTATAQSDQEWVPKDTFGARLTLVRQYLGGWTVAQAAEFCDIGDQSWRAWERGINTPRDYEGVTLKIAKATGCSVDWLRAGGPLLRSWWSSLLPHNPFGGNLRLVPGLPRSVADTVEPGEAAVPGGNDG